MFRLVSRLAALLALCVVVLGAYVRIEDAGLGCPDWPGCYGQLVGVPDSGHEIAAAEAAFPHAPVEVHKAWKEMAHRYLAGTLGLLILGLTVAAWRERQPSRGLLATTCAVVVAQATLGMLTVTELLRPGIVTLHLIGGLTTLALLTANVALQSGPPRLRFEARLQLAPWVRAALAVLVLQLVLGGWVSTNYAGLACADFPSCQGGWWPAMDAGQGFDVTRALHLDAEGQPVSGAALTAIHWAHRLGAVLVAILLSGLAFALWRAGERRWTALLLALLGLQLALGIANVLLRLPVVLAVAHNAGAALLLGALIWLLVTRSRPRSRMFA